MKASLPRFVAVKMGKYFFNGVTKIWKTRIIGGYENRSVSTFPRLVRVSRRGILEALFIWAWTYCRLFPRLHKKANNSLVFLFLSGGTDTVYSQCEAERYGLFNMTWVARSMQEVMMSVCRLYK